MFDAFDPARLNEAQRRAVEFPLEPLLVLAGPGTGKTRTLVCRVLRLIEHYGLKPDQLLAVTYTNKATEEMRQRFRYALGDAARQLSVGTFHGFCVRVLRDHHARVNLPKHFTVADEEWQLHVLGQVVRNLTNDNREKHLRTLMGRLSAARLNEGESQRPLSNTEKQIFKAYQARLRENCLIDFDDILFLTHQLFLDNSSILQTYRESLKGLLIDEFQDTDRIQYDIMKMLAGEHMNIFAVADDDQSIFAWRGANRINIERFKQDFAGKNQIQLETNYRSTEAIIAQATCLIEKNPRLAIKRVSPLGGEGLPVQFERFTNESEEAAFIIQTVVAAIRQNPELRLNEFAALYARHSIGENLEQEFMKAGIPCQLVRGKSILDHSEIARALTLLRLIYTPQNQVALEKFFESELDEVTFARLKEIEDRLCPLNFRAALDLFRKSVDIPIPERKRVDKLIGYIANLIELKNSSSNQRLSNLLAEITNCLTSQSLSLLQPCAQQLSDPLSYQNMAAAAHGLGAAVTDQNPIVVVGANSALRFLIAELLGRVFPAGDFKDSDIDGLPASLESKSEAAGCDPTQTDNKAIQTVKRKELGLLLVLDSATLCRIAAEALNAANVVNVIYVGVEPPFSAAGGNLSQEQKLFSDGDLASVIFLNPFEAPAVERGLEPSTIALAFKLCQATTSLASAWALADYTAIDIETTDLDIETNEIIELAAVRVRNGAPVAHYEVLIRPERPIAKEAQAVHGLSEEMLRSAPEFKDVIPNFLEFIGADLLVAHNGYRFDFPCLRNRLRAIGRTPLNNRIFDTLPFAQRLYPGQGASVDALALRFNLETGQRHRAYDDTTCLVQIFECLKRENEARSRVVAHEAQLDIVALGLLVEHGALHDANALLLKHGAPRLLTTSSNILTRLRTRFPEARIGDLQEMIERLAHDQDHTTTTQETYGLLARFDEIIRRFDDLPLEAAIAEFLTFTSLYQQQDGLEQRDAVSLMTIYAAKGLEFRRVFIAGLEQNVIPSIYSVKSNDPEQICEQRRLLYVAMTRAKEHLVLTCVGSRDGYPHQPSAFLTELNLGLEFEASAGAGQA